MARKYTDLGHPEYDALWPYTLLQDPLPELARLSLATSLAHTDSVTFQPSPNPDHANQDRCIVQTWDLPDGTWSFLAVLDGHAGHDTVDYIQSALPTFLRASLTAAHPASPSTVAAVLSTAITDLDNSITAPLLALFPNPDSFANLDDATIQAIINNGQNTPTLMRCMRGTTALVALIDPHAQNLWVASLGDCQAVLGIKTPDGQIGTRLLSANHNGSNPSEAARIRAEHFGEPECILNDRVLGAIAVTRALGDHLFKLPAPYTERIFLNAQPPFRFATPVAEFLARNRTPPYVSSTPDVQHLALDTLPGTPTELIMCSDGLIDLCSDGDDNEESDLRATAARWVRAVRVYAAAPGPEDNRALALLRHALGGDDAERVSRMMTVEMDMRWMDDTTILVHRFD